jgi:hypothetical protein
VIYLSGTLHRDLYGTPCIGMMLSPASTKAVPDGMPWAADNGAFLGKYPGDDAFLAWLDAMPRAGCLFAVAPDVVGDARATWERSAPLLPEIRARGFPAALALQNGVRFEDVDWSLVDGVLVGGDNAFKMAEATYELIARIAREHARIWRHMGRVNGETRFRAARVSLYQSADGTNIRFNPGRYVPELMGWMERARLQPALPLWERSGI